MTDKIPFLRPNPPKLSELLDQLAEIEASNIYSNYGPVNTLLEQSLIRQLFAGSGACVTVCNATIGLMLAIRLALGVTPDKGRKYALMPSFTFAATAHAAIWAGLIPLLCDIESDTWLPAAAAEDELLEKYGDEIAVIVPYATFGNNLDLDRYGRLSKKYNIPVVVDAAASLGSSNDNGDSFGTGLPPARHIFHARDKDVCYVRGRSDLLRRCRHHRQAAIDGKLWIRASPNCHDAGSEFKTQRSSGASRATKASRLQ